MTVADATITEAEWQEQVIQIAHLTGWRHLHVRRSIGKGRQWTTATNIIGWPDLLLWAPDRGFIALELKSETGKATPEQLAVLRELEASGARTMIARPSDAHQVVALLQAGPNNPQVQAS